MHISAVQYALMCLVGLSEWHLVHRGFFVVHCIALWNGLLHHVLVHIVAVHCCLMCLVGLSEWHLVHRGLFVVVSFLLLFFIFVVFFIFVAFSCVLFGVLHWYAL